MKIVALKTRTDLSLIYSKIPEDLYQGSTTLNGEWTAGSYSIGDQFYYSGVQPHRVYTSKVNTNTSIPGSDTTKWTNNGATDRWLMFDEYMESQSPYDEEFTVEVDSSNLNYTMLARIVAINITLTLFVNTQLLTGGDCSADTFDKGTGWTHDSGNTEYDSDGSQTAVSLLTQSIITTEDVKYLVKFTLQNFSAGTLGGYAGGTSGTGVAVNGDYAQILTAGADGLAGVVASDDFVGSVTDISSQKVPKSETIETRTSATVDWYTYLLQPVTTKELISWDFPKYANSTLRATITYVASSDAKVGIMSMGFATFLGETTYGGDIGYIDYSRKVTDPDFGFTYLAKGSYADDGDFNVWIDTNKVDTIKRILVANRGVATILDFNEENADIGTLEALVYYCFLGQPRVTLVYKTKSRLRIEAIGLI